MNKDLVGEEGNRVSTHTRRVSGLGAWQVLGRIGSQGVYLPRVVGFQHLQRFEAAGLRAKHPEVRVKLVQRPIDIHMCICIETHTHIHIYIYIYIYTYIHM